jgi:two-component system, response regulator
LRWSVHGVEALDYLFGTGRCAGRDTSLRPAVVILDLQLLKVDGFEVLRRLRADERTKLLAVIVLTSSKEQQDIVQSLAWGLTATFASRWISSSLSTR